MTPLTGLELYIFIFGNLVFLGCLVVLLIMLYGKTR